MKDRTFRWECLKSDLADLLLRVRDALGWLLLLLLGIGVLALNVLDTLGVVNHIPLLQELYWPLIIVSYAVIAVILFLERRRLHRKRRRKENPPTQ